MLKTDPVVVDLLEVFVDGVITRQHGDGWKGQVEHHQGQHVGHVVPAGSSQARTKTVASSSASRLQRFNKKKKNLHLSPRV